MSSFYYILISEVTVVAETHAAVFLNKTFTNACNDQMQNVIG